MSEVVSLRNKDKDEPEVIKTKIIFLLGIFPVLSPSMLQVGLGVQYRPKDWRPVLDQMIRDGLVRREEQMMPTPFGQHRTYTLLTLPKVSTSAN